MSMILYDYILSGSSYKVRLLMAILKADYDTVAVDFYPGGEHRKPEFLALNPAGTLPVLVDGETTLCDTQAILAYVARKHDSSGTWFPVEEIKSLAHILQWMAFSGRLTDTAGAARLHDMIARPLDIKNARRGAHKALRELESHLTERGFDGKSFLVTDHPTIADIACFPYVALSPDGGITHDDYPAIRKWLIAVRRLPGFIEMPGIHALHDLKQEVAE